MNEGRGTITRDAVNGINWTLSAQAAWITGYFGSGLNLGAVNGTYIVTPGNVPSANLSSNHAWTIVIAYKPNGHQTACKMFAKGNNNNPSWDIDIESALTQDFCFTYKAADATKFGTGANFWPTLNRYGRWNYFFWVHRPDGTGTTSINTLSLYVNGSSFTINVTDPTGGTAPTFAGNTSALSLGNYSDGSAAQKCSGDFDEVAVYHEDVTGGTHVGAKNFYYRIVGNGGSSWGP
jgi:hypothetical protein